MKGRAAGSGRLLQHQKKSLTKIQIPARRVIRRPDGSLDLTAEVVGPGYEFRTETITASTSYGRRRFLMAVDSIEPRVRESLLNLQPLRGQTKKWAVRWNLNSAWILDVAIASLILWNQNLSPDREWVFPFLVDHRFESEDFRVRGFVPTIETQGGYREYVAWCLEHYIDHILAEAHNRGLEPIPERRQREGDHFDWLARYQISKWSFYKIAKSVKTKKPKLRGVDPGIDQSAVARAIKSLADELPIGLRRSDSRT